MHSKKNISNILNYYIQTKINILIIFFTQYFQIKISDLMVKISPFNQRV
jgi:hypothetical protein